MGRPLSRILRYTSELMYFGGSVMFCRCEDTYLSDAEIREEKRTE